MRRWIRLVLLLIILLTGINCCTTLDIVVISRNEYTNLSYNDRIRYSAALYESNLSNYYTLVEKGNGLYKIRFKLLLMEKESVRNSNKN